MFQSANRKKLCVGQCGRLTVDETQDLSKNVFADDYDKVTLTYLISIRTEKLTCRCKQTQKWLHIKGGV